MSRKPRIGLLVVLFEGWLALFPDLKARLREYISAFLAIADGWADVANAGIITTEDEAIQASRFFMSKDVDVVVMPGVYSTSGLVIRALPRARTPVLFWITQLSEVIGGPLSNRASRWSAIAPNLGCLSLPEATSVLTQVGRPFGVITGSMNDKSVIAKTREFTLAAAVARSVANSRIGVVGPRFPGMLDVGFDEAALMQKLGVQVINLQVADLESAVDAVTETEINELLQETRLNLQIDPSIPAETIHQSARVACSLSILGSKFKLHAIAIGGDHAPPDLLLSEKIGILPGLQDIRESARSLKLTTEADVRAAICLLLLEYLNMPATMFEAWMIDFSTDRILLGHDGPPDIRLAKQGEKPRIVPGNPWMEGKRGIGCVVEYSLAPGDATLVTLIPSGDQGFFFVTSEGTIPDTPTLELGMPNSWFTPDGGIVHFYDRWTQLGGNHHFAIARGRLSERIEQIGTLLGVKTLKV